MKPVLSEPRFHNETAAFEYVEAMLWPNGPVCPHCGETKRVGELKGKSTRPGLRKCYACRKPFTVRMGTIFESSHVKLNIWLQAIHLLCSSKKGISTRQLQRTFGGSMKTAWFLTHRIREAMKPADGTGPLGDDGDFLEVDETFVGRKATSKAFLPPSEKLAVLALVERGGRARSVHLPNVRVENLGPALMRNASKNAHLMTDEYRTYKSAAPWFASHQYVTHSANEYARGDAGTNTVEGFFSILKRGLYGTYQHVSEAHLQRYLAEFDFRYSNRAKLGIDDVARTEIAITGAKGKRLTYQTTRSQRATA